MPSTEVFIIAEAGVNHNGSVKTAKKLIDVAARAGADAVKFQTFKMEAHVSVYAPKAEYQKMLTAARQSQFDMLKALELGAGAHRRLLEYCNQKEIIFLSSPFDLESIDLLNGLGLEILKIPSREITNMPYMRKIGALGKKIIMSTGMAGLDEVRGALGILISSGMKKEDITVLHCTTAYPAAFKDVNLKAMLTIKDALGVKVGYSDHTTGIEAAIAAVALGAVVIEKHFTLDRNMEGPDHKASLMPEDLRQMVKAVRNIEESLGDGIKRPAGAEEAIKKVIRKCIVSRIDIPQGALISEEILAVKRAGLLR